MGGDTPLWVQMLISWAPFILFAFFFAVFMEKEGVRGRQKRIMEYIERSEQHMKRVEELLERVLKDRER